MSGVFIKDMRAKHIKCACRSVPGVFGNQQANHLDLIKQMLQQSVLDPTNYEVM